jgi:metallo-beta-lactamase class B
MRLAFVVIGLAGSLVLPQEVSVLRPDPPIQCGTACDEWNARKPGARVFGNTYQVGPAGLGSVLVTSQQGHILLDAGLPQSAPLIDVNLRNFGFRSTDIKLIVNSHAHYDHAGGIAAFQRASGATVAASAAGAQALERGEPTADDPQYAYGPDRGRFPAVKNVRVVKDGEVLRVGDLAITAHLTPGHTTGSTTWSWRSCEDKACRDFVYADSLNPVSAPGFRFMGDATRPSRVGSIAKVAALPCDVLIAVHPSMGAGKTCRTYADDASRRLDARIKEEK